MNSIKIVNIAKYLSLSFVLSFCVYSSTIAEEIYPLRKDIDYILQEKNEDITSKSSSFPKFIIKTITSDNSNSFLSGNSFLSQLVIATCASVVGVFAGAIVTDYKIRRDYKPRRLKQGERKNTILLIGLGRTGKTELVKYLSKPLSNNEDTEITNNFNIYSFSRTDDSNVKYNFDITDYRGQNFSQLISNFINEQLKRKTKLRYGDINSLVLIVDLFKYEKDWEHEYLTLDTDRITENKEQWNLTCLDGVFGLLTEDTLKYVCLFINKVDKWQSSLTKEEQEVQIKEQYKDLIDNLKDRSTLKDESGSFKKKLFTFEVIIGSVKRGTHLNTLIQNLIIYSVPLEKRLRDHDERSI